MSAIPSTRRYTVDEYFELDQSSDTRYEYVYGYVVAMAGASPEHELILTNLSAQIGPQLRKKRVCRIYGSNLRTQIKKNGRYAYPDAVIVCGDIKTGHQQTLLNPTIVVEVLSSSTKSYDLNDKGDDYRKIASLKDIIYIYQDRPGVTIVSRQDDQWVIKDYEQLSDTVELTSIEATLSLSDLYDQIDFPPSEDEEPFIEDNI